ncbi:MAG: TonB-dependent receptor [Pseudomonadota bacterium]
MSVRSNSIKIAFALGAMSVAGATLAQEGEVEEVTVTGLRGAPRTAVDAAVPVDTFDSSAIEAVSHTDTQDILQTLVPSYNVGRQPISDGSTFIRPASLRGLPSHHTLVLVNGKRRHRASLVTIGGDGAQGPDVATIPSIAIQSIEVLRDGASSQYGSDAIAGVINFNLKQNSEGIDVALDTGQFYESDGTSITAQANVGLPLGDSGFLSISGEFNDADFTERAEQYCESWFCVDPDNPRFDPEAGYADFVLGRPNPDDARLDALQQAFPGGIDDASVQGSVVQPWGQPNTRSARFFYNAGYDFDNGMELYSFGSYSDSEGDGSFFYRYPGNGTIEDLRLEDGSLYSPLEIFPGGFTPRFEGEVTDYSVAGGLRSQENALFSWDASARYGFNEIDYRLFNTINPSLGPDTPTDFRPGTLTNEEFQVQLDMTSEFDIGTASPLVVAYGVSYLDESYDVGQSDDPASYTPGPFAAQDPFGFCTDEADVASRTATAAGQAVIDNGSSLNCADASDAVYTVVGVGSNGFPGYSPEFSDTYERDSFAVYLDLSADVTEKLLLQGAVRFEDYSDFGSVTVGKVAARYYLAPNFAVRSSWGTGFRAPTPGQQGTTNVSTRLPNGFPVATGLFPASGTVAQALGASPLDAETSDSFTVGFTAAVGALDLTVDFYRIDIDDRFNAISTLDVSADPDSGDAFDNFLALQAAGVVGAESIGGVNYFTNAFDSRTQGVDVVATYPVAWGSAGTTDFMFSMNYNENELRSDASEFLNPEAQFDFENADPNLRFNVMGVHSVGPFSVLARGRFFGPSDNSDNTTPLSIQEYDSTLFVDLEASYQITDNVRMTVGGRNIFDTFPDEVDRIASDNDFCCGRIFASSSIVPWQGGFYYARLNASF